MPDGTLTDGSIEPVDSGPLTDATVATVPPEQPSIDPLHVDCDAVENDTLPPGIERIGGDGWMDWLTTSGAAISWVDQSGLRHRADPESEFETLTSSIEIVRSRRTARRSFFGLTPGAIAEISLIDHEVVNVAFESIAVNITGLAVDDDNVYWASDEGDGDTVTFWRSDREPGVTAMVGNAHGFDPRFLHVTSDWLYFLIGPGTDDGEMQLHRLRKDGSEPTEAIGDPVAGLRFLFADGNDLFALISTGRGTPGLPRGDNRVVRIDPEDGSMDTLFETQRAWTATLDATYVYWIANASFNDESIVALWRGRRDGEGEPIQLAEGWNHPGGWRTVAVSDDSIYFNTGICDSSDSNIMHMAKPDP